MSIKLSEEKYKKLKKEVIKNRPLINLEGLSAEDKEKLVNDHAETLLFDNDEEKQFYIANFLIPNDKEFCETYIQNGKNLKKCAEAFGVTSNIILIRAFELGKYQEYMPKIITKKGEQKMSEVEIIDAFPVGNIKETKKDDPAVEKHVEDDTQKAISRINQLFEMNLSQEKTIASQIKTIDNQNNQIANLEANLKDKETIIMGLKETIKKKEEEIVEDEKTIRELEEEIEGYRKTIKELTPYRDSYKKIIGFLDKNIEKDNLDQKTI